MKPNPTLDRLLGIFHSHILRLDNNFGFSVSEMEEINNLKSQLESKLADGEKYQQLDWMWSEQCWNCKSKRISRNEQTHTELCLDCGNGGTVPIAVKTQEDRQIQSQYTNLVKAIQKLLVDNPECDRHYDLSCVEKTRWHKLLQKLLEATKEKA